MRCSIRHARTRPPIQEIKNWPPAPRRVSSSARASIVQRVRTRRHEALGDAVARVDLFLLAAARRRQRHRGFAAAVVVAAPALDVEAAAQGERRRGPRVCGAGSAHAGEDRVGGVRLRRLRGPGPRARGGRQSGGGEDEQERQEEEAEAPAPRRAHHGCGRARPDRWQERLLLGRGEQSGERVLGVSCSGSWMGKGTGGGTSERDVRKLGGRWALKAVA